MAPKKRQSSKFDEPEDTEARGMSQFQIVPPEQFDFSNPNSWERWIKRFDRFREASELYRKPSVQQVSMLIYALGEEGEELFETFDLSEEERQSYDAVKASFGKYLGQKKNIVYERAKFLKRRQQLGEPVDCFINDLRKLAETCEFQNLKASLIRDLIVIGVNDSKLSEKLQLDERLTLDKAILMARQSESVKNQQKEIRGESSDVGMVAGRSKPSAQFPPSSSKCSRCGLFINHGTRPCPAVKGTCHICGLQGHFSRCCKRRGSFKKEVKEVECEEEINNEYLGELTISELNEDVNSMRYVTFHVNKHDVTFKIDTGADVTVIGLAACKRLGLELKPFTRTLQGPNGVKLEVLGRVNLTLTHKSKSINEPTYVLQEQKTPLLSYSASIELGLLTLKDNRQHRLNRAEPLITTGLPENPWELLGIDLFKFANKWYMVIEDYYSRFIEVIMLSSLTSIAIIQRLKNIFARHGVPLEVRTDDRAQFTSSEFKQFAQQFGFKVAVSSPYFAQSNGGAERAVQTAKRILSMNVDTNLGLLAYRTSPLESGLSPAELLYGRKIRSTLPSAQDFKKTTSEEGIRFARKDAQIKFRNKRNFEGGRGVRELTPLKRGDMVWISDLKQNGTIRSKLKEFPRSYTVQLENEGEVRRNRKFLVELPREN